MQNDVTWGNSNANNYVSKQWLAFENKNIIPRVTVMVM